jgi:hypothetical protein
MNLELKNKKGLLNNLYNIEIIKSSLELTKTSEKNVYRFNFNESLEPYNINFARGLNNEENF